MVLTGGGSCLAGVAERIEAELKNAARFHTLPHHRRPGEGYLLGVLGLLGLYLRPGPGNPNLTLRLG